MITALQHLAFSCVLTTLLAGCIPEDHSGVLSDDVSSLARDDSVYADSEASSSSTALNSADESEVSALQPSGNCRLSVLDERLLIKLNEVRAEARLCGETPYEAVGPVVWNCALEGAADRHSSDMATNNFFSHTGSDGLRVGARADAAGYDWVMVGENIAVGYSSVNSVMQGWLDSPSHCRTIMNASYQETALSIALPADSDYASYWTLLMGLRSSLQ
jgi:uncharacterized protein YkwD